MEIFISAVVLLSGLMTLMLIRQAKRVELLSQEIGQLQVSNKMLQNNNKYLADELNCSNDRFKKEVGANKKLLSQKKSSEVKLGQMSEHLVPVLGECRHDPRNMRFLGSPLDFVVFDLDQGEITFLEVKTGKSQTSKKQKTLKNIIKEGRVFYEEMRINEKGIKSKGKTGA